MTHEEPAFGEVYVQLVDGQPVITKADPVAAFALELLAASELIKVRGDEITLLGLVTYRVTGYDDGFLIAELVEDRRDKKNG